MLKNFKLFAALIAALTALSGCHDEKELIVIDKNTPLKVSALYVMGDASAAGWDLGAGLEMDPVRGTNGVFTWQGWLRPGWISFSLDNNSWNKMIRPMVENSPVGMDPVVDEPFEYPTSANTNWLVKVPGTYHLTVNVPNRTFSSEYVGSDSGERYETLYLLGDATVAGWDLGSAISMNKVEGDDAVFTWEGHLKPGWMLFSIENTSFDKLVRPIDADTPVGLEPTVDQPFDYPTDKDTNWLVQEEGNYFITVNMTKFTFSSEYVK